MPPQPQKEGSSAAAAAVPTAARFVNPYGFAGIGKDGTLFGPGTVASWVDTKQAPGYTDQREQLGLRATLYNVRACVRADTFVGIVDRCACACVRPC